MIEKVFGGAGLFSSGKMFALIHGGILYFKVDGSNEGDYSDKGSSPFIPPFGKRIMSHPQMNLRVSSSETAESASPSPPPPNGGGPRRGFLRMKMPYYEVPADILDSAESAPYGAAILRTFSIGQTSTSCQSLPI